MSYAELPRYEEGMEYKAIVHAINTVVGGGHSSMVRSITAGSNLALFREGFSAT